MRLTSLKLKGFSSAFPGLIDLPLGDLAPGIVAVVGGNGQGKTSLLEATPAAIYRRLPARNGMDPVDFATARDAFIDLEYTFEDGQAFRSRLNLDGPGRKTDALLEQIGPDGTRIPLNNGQRSTYDKAMAERFPSLDLFINSVFAAQGRGDEFARTTGTKRKDLFVEFLALKRLLTMAKAAGEAAGLCGDATFRLSVQIETLARETAPAVSDALMRLAEELQAKGAAAELRQGELKIDIADLETRQHMAGDGVAAYAAANARVRTLSADRQARVTELEQLQTTRTTNHTAALVERQGIETRLASTLEDIAKRLAGNETIQQQADSIRAAVASLSTVDEQLVLARDEERTAHTQCEAALQDLADADRTVSTFAVPRQQLERAKGDSALLATVPCGGIGEYAACQFLINATTAHHRIAELEALVAGLTGAIHERDRHVTRVGATRAALDQVRETVATLKTQRDAHERTAKYQTALAEAEARIAELTRKRAEIEADAARLLAEAEGRLLARSREFEAQEARLQVDVDRLAGELVAAQQDLDAAAAGNSQAVELQRAIVAARQDWDVVTRTLADVTSGRAELTRRREHLEAQRDRLVDARERLALVENELLEWQFLQKALGKGGLPDLEIDAAGPTISATTNQLLVSSYGSRFSLELVTQVEKAGGAGMKDEFTVRVFDNEATDGRGWRDISELSGGEKVVVQEAFMCSIALYVNERSPLPIRTLFRDETGAALDPDNAVRYTQMLRKVRELGAFHHVFYISHNPAAAALADAQIQVGGGQARIVLPPFVDQVAA